MCQFHLLFYSSRPLANTFASVCVNFALGDWVLGSMLPESHTEPRRDSAPWPTAGSRRAAAGRSVAWMAVACIVFRCDMALLSACIIGGQQSHSARTRKEDNTMRSSHKLTCHSSSSSRLDFCLQLRSCIAGWICARSSNMDCARASSPSVTKREVGMHAALLLRARARRLSPSLAVVPLSLFVCALSRHRVRRLLLLASFAVA